MSFRYRHLILIAALVMGWWIIDARAALAQSTPCSNNTQCNVEGSVCVFPGRVCGDFVLDFNFESFTSTAYSTTVTANTGAQTFSLWSCFGISSTCGSPSTNPTAWTSYGTLQNFPISLTGLRPGRTYNVTFFGDPTGTTAGGDVVTRTFTTWPAPWPTATVSNLQPRGATITWATPFSGTSDVWYGTQPPGWRLGPLGSPSSQNLLGVTATSTGTAWAVGGSGLILKRASQGSAWVSQPNPVSGGSFLTSVDAYNDQTAWAAGYFGNVVRTANGGSSWTGMNPGPTTHFNRVVAPTSNTAWVVGESGSVFWFDGSAWQNRQDATISTTSIQAVTTVNNREVWLGGFQGRNYRSANGGEDWTVGPAFTNSTIFTMATVDGRVIWAGDEAGRIWRSADGGVNFTNVYSSAQGYSIQEIYAVGANEIYFTNSFAILRLRDGAVDFASPTPFAQIGGAIEGFAVGSPDDLIGVGQLSRISEYSLLYFTPNPKSGAAGTNHSVTFTNELQAGTPYYFIASTNGSGVTATATGQFTTPSPDSTPPDISFAPLPPTYTNQNPLSVTGTASDNISLQSVEVLNGTAVQAVTTNPNLPNQPNTNWSASVNLAPGPNALQATATDTSSNTRSASATVTLDQSVPTVTITNPSNGSTVSSATTPLTGLANDPGGEVATMQYSLNNAPRQTIPISAGASVNYVTNVPGLTIGPNTIEVFARDRAGNEGSATTSFTYAEPTFTLSVSPSSVAITPGDAAVYNVTVQSVNGFTAPVNLNVVGQPSGSTVMFSPQPVTPPANDSATATLTITTASTAAGGTFPLTISGSGGSKNASTSATLILKDFSMSVSPVGNTIIAGQPAGFILTVSPDGNFTGTVALSLSGLPANTAATGLPGSMVFTGPTTQNANISITTQTTAPTGPHTITVTGTSGTLTRTATYVLTINAAPDYTLTFTRASETITAGQSVSYTGSIRALNGFNEDVDLAITASPSDPNLSLTVQPATVRPAPAGVPISVSVATTSAVAGGTYTLTITADSSTVDKTTTLTLIVNADTTPPVISNVVATPNWNSVRINWTTDEPANAEVVIYDDAGLSQNPRIISDNTYCTGACWNLFYQPLLPSTTYYFSVRSCDQAIPANCASASPFNFTTLDEPDTVAPTVIIQQPAGGTEVFGATDIQAAANDNKSVANVQLTITNLATPTAPFTQTLNCSGATCTASYSWNSTLFTNGSYEIKAVATDTAGNISNPDTRVVTVNNDNTPPVLSCPNEIIEVMPGSTDCGNGQPCWQAIISWSSDDPSTSEIDFCEGLSCTYNQQKRYDDSDPSNGSPVHTNHQVTLQNLLPDRVYHYRITSVNRSGLISHACQNPGNS